MRAVFKELNNGREKPFIENSEACTNLHSRSKTSEAGSAETAFNTVADVPNSTEHSRFKEKVDPSAPLSYNPHSTSARKRNNPGANTGSNLTTSTMHPKLIRKARFLQNRVATDSSRQSTPFSTNSSQSSLTLATSENELSVKTALFSKDLVPSVSTLDAKNHKPHSSSNVEEINATEIPASETRLSVASGGKGGKTRQYSVSNSGSERITTRSITRSAKSSSCAQPAEEKFLPIGPRHLEYDYREASRQFRLSVYAAIYDHCGWSPHPTHQMAAVPKPGRECMAIIKEDPRVTKTARILNEADDRLKEALSRGETWENTLIPDEWRWGSEFLKSCGEELRTIEELAEQPQDIPAKPKRERKCRTSVPLEVVKADSAGPKTRSGKRKAEFELCDPQSRDQCTQEAKVSLDTESNVHTESSTNDLVASTCKQIAPEHANSPIFIVIPPRAQVNNNEPVTKSSPSVPTKGPRGRPRKRKAEDEVHLPFAKESSCENSAKSSPPLRQSKRRRTMA